MRISTTMMYEMGLARMTEQQSADPATGLIRELPRLAEKLESHIVRHTGSLLCNDPHFLTTHFGCHHRIPS